MWIKLFVVFFCGGLVGLDTTAAWQGLFSHPLIACTLVGYLFGEPQIGLFFGILFELIWLYDMPVGGAKFPDGNLSSFIGLMVVLTLLDRTAASEPWLVLLSCIYSVIIAYFLGQSIVFMRKNNLFLVQKADRFAKSGNVKKIELMHRLGIVHTYLNSAIWGMLFYLIGLFLIHQFLKLLPDSAPFSLIHIQVIFLGIGLLLMIKLFLTKKKLVYLILGLICGCGFGIII